MRSDRSSNEGMCAVNLDRVHFQAGIEIKIKNKRGVLNTSEAAIIPGINSVDETPFEGRF